MYHDRIVEEYEIAGKKKNWDFFTWKKDDEKVKV